MFITEMHAIGDRCVAVNARIMVTHDATADSIRALLPDFRVRRPMLRTLQALGAMFAFHRQDLRIFGGRHLSAGAVVNRTRVQCPSEFRFCPVMHHERRRTRLYAGTEQIRDGQCGMHGRRRDGSGRRRLFPVNGLASGRRGLVCSCRQGQSVAQVKGSTRYKNFAGMTTKPTTWSSMCLP